MAKTGKAKKEKALNIARHKISCTALSKHALAMCSTTHLFFREYSGDGRISPVHLASAALQLRVKR